MLLEIIEKNFNEALKQKRMGDLAVLRGLKTAIHNREIELKAKKQELSEQDILEIIRKEVKKRREAVELYEQGKRPELADKEKNEIDVLNRYLPKELPDDKIKEVILEVVKETEAAGLQDLGRVMGAVMSRLKGQVEGNRVKKIVEKQLNNLTN